MTPPRRAAALCAAAAAPAAAAPAATCADYGGIPHSVKPGEPQACCLAACGDYCGATGCNSPKGPGGDDCCASHITKAGKVCGEGGNVAPCIIPSSPAPPAPPSPPSPPAPSKWDWRDVNGTNWLTCCGAEVRNHHLYPPAAWGPPYTGGCASCWCFSSTNVLSDRMFIQSGGKVRALPSCNYLLDCMPGQRDCGYPGSASAAYKFLTEHGVPDESCSPTDAALGGNAQHCTDGSPCPGVCTTSTMCRNRTDGKSGAAYSGTLYGVESWGSVPATEAGIMAELMNGPMPAGICVDGGDKSHPDPDSVILGYKGGVITASSGASCAKVNHDVNYVGWGTASAADGGLDYWLVRNNWGTSWGEGGFFRIERRKDAFVIESHVRYVAPRKVW